MAPYELLPLRPVACQLVLALADGERHGFGIVRDVSQRTAARMIWSRATSIAR
jgi:hypothetical protein